MIIWNSSFFPALYSSCSELNHKKIQYCSSSGLSRLCSSFLDLSNFLISGKSSNEKKPETRNSWNEEFPETRKILKRGISWNEEILSHHRLLCFITNIKRNTAGLSARQFSHHPLLYSIQWEWFVPSPWSPHSVLSPRLALSFCIICNMHNCPLGLAHLWANVQSCYKKKNPKWSWSGRSAGDLDASIGFQTLLMIWGKFLFGQTVIFLPDSIWDGAIDEVDGKLKISW